MAGTSARGKRIHHQVVKRCRLTPDFHKAQPLCGGMHALAGAIFLGGHMPEGTGAMPEQQAQTRLDAAGGGNFVCQSGEHVQARGVRAGFVCDQRAA